MQEYLEIGQIVNTFGVKGMVKVNPFTDDITRFDKLKKVYICKKASMEEVEIEEVKEGQNVAATSTPKEQPQQEVKKAQPVSSGESITAPMPGTITNILVKEGDNVKKGQVLAILEAMKMENEIVAPHDGAVKAISVDKGQNVNPGETLLKMA